MVLAYLYYNVAQAGPRRGAGPIAGEGGGSPSGGSGRCLERTNGYTYIYIERERERFIYIYIYIYTERERYMHMYNM